MGWVARIIVISATLLGGCAALAGIGDSNPVDDNAEGGGGGTSGTNGTSGTSGTSGTRDASGSSGTGDGAASVDSSVKDATQGCTLKQNGATCQQPGDCCSDACAGDHRCSSSCGTSGGCLKNADCCVKSYCSSFQCAACRLDGTAAEKFTFMNVTTPIVSSCCSNMVNASGNCGP